MFARAFSSSSCFVVWQREDHIIRIFNRRELLNDLLTVSEMDAHHDGGSHND